MELADRRGSNAVLGARKSLRAFKRTPQYQSILKGFVERRETASMSDRERRRLRLERLLAGMELDRLQRGEPLSEFHGLLALPDPLNGLRDEEDE